MEYTKASKAQMSLLVSRINTLATDHAAELGTALCQQLQSYLPQWEAALHEQSTAKGTLNDGRAGRNILRTNLEKALLTAIHLVASQYPGDIAKCMGFFDFSLLTAITHKPSSDVPPPAAGI